MISHSDSKAYLQSAQKSALVVKENFSKAHLRCGLGRVIILLIGLQQSKGKVHIISIDIIVTIIISRWLIYPSCLRNGVNMEKPRPEGQQQ